MDQKKPQDSKESTNPFFDCLNSIMTTKEYWYQDGVEYNPIGINVGLSQHIDAVLHVNQLNQVWQHLSPRMHYDYYYNSIRRMRRKFGKWAKRHKDEDIGVVMEYYGINRLKAESYLQILTEKCLEEIKERLSGN